MGEVRLPHYIRQLFAIDQNRCDLMEALYKGVKPSELYGDSLRYLKMLVKNAYISQTGLTMTWSESFTYFMDGNAAMLPQGPWMIGIVKNQIDPPINPEVFELGVMFFPEEPYKGITAEAVKQ